MFNTRWTRGLDIVRNVVKSLAFVKMHRREKTLKKNERKVSERVTNAIDFVVFISFLNLLNMNENEK